jgi:hypothetical protein
VSQKNVDVVRQLIALGEQVRERAVTPPARIGPTPISSSLFSTKRVNDELAEAGSNDVNAAEPPHGRGLFSSSTPEELLRDGAH